MMAIETKNKNLDKVFWRLSKYVESNIMHYVENCISCGICYEICPAFHIDKRYAPASIGEWFRRFYRRYMNPIARVLGKLAHAYPLTRENLLKAREYVYRCTNCTACYMVCAAGIDSGALALMCKALVDSAGLTPQVVKTLEEMEAKRTYLTPQVMDLYAKFQEELKKYVAEVPVNERDRTLFIPVSVVDLVLGRDALIATIRILERLGLTWTIPSEPVGIRPPMGYVTGNFGQFASLVRRIYIQARELNSKMILIVDSGYTYPALRFEGPYIAEMEQPCKILSIVELLEDYAERGLLPVRKGYDAAIWHDPCMLLRRGGVEMPHALLERITTPLKPKWKGRYTKCCGGGSHMFFMQEEVAKALSEVLDVDLVKMLDSSSREIAEFGLKMAEHRVEELLEKMPRVITTACLSCIFMLRKALEKVATVKIDVKHVAELTARLLM